MEAVIVAVILAVVGIGFYQRGKQVGSRKGYHAGRQDGRRRRSIKRHGARSFAPTGITREDR